MADLRNPVSKPTEILSRIIEDSKKLIAESQTLIQAVRKTHERVNHTAALAKKNTKRGRSKS
jgi:hypothetical protein